MDKQSVAFSPSPRQLRAAQLAASGRVMLRCDGTVSVRSQSNPDGAYLVDPCANFNCTCPDMPAARRGQCKHAWAARAIGRGITKVSRALDAGTLDEDEARWQHAAEHADSEFSRLTAQILLRASLIIRALPRDRYALHMVGLPIRQPRRSSVGLDLIAYDRLHPADAREALAAIAARREYEVA